MDNDAIRSSGSNTLVELWIDGKLRSICVTRAAIEAYLEMPAEQGEAMTDEQRCEFVRNHMSTVVTAARDWMRLHGPAADSIIIDGGQLPRPGGSADRRRTERRKGADRRKPESSGVRLEGDRRQGDRRKTDRRKKR